jgi:pyruvate kinase
LHGLEIKRYNAARAESPPGVSGPLRPRFDSVSKAFWPRSEPDRPLQKDQPTLELGRMPAVASTSTLLQDLHQMRREIQKEADAQMAIWKPWIKRKPYLLSAYNLAAYLAFRKRDFRPYQDALYPLGLSSMSNCESHVMPNFDAVIHALYALEQLKPFSKYFDAEGAYEHLESTPNRKRDFQQAGFQLDREIDALLGKPGQGRRTRIVVTLPSEAAEDKAWVQSLIEGGADACRINCAHDDADIWNRMVEHVRSAERKTGKNVRILMDLAGPKIRTGSVTPLTKRDRLAAGDGFWLHPETGWKWVEGGPVAFGKTKVNPQFLISCTLPEALAKVKKDDRVFLDDGLFSGRVLGRWGMACYVQIERAPEGGKRIKADKGINLPDTDFTIDLPTAHDRLHLPTVIKHAHMVGYSFVQCAGDVHVLQEQLQSQAAHRPKELGRLPAIVAKIETARAITNLPEILVAAAGQGPTGLMIARGDLAVEIGFLRLAEMQEELLWVAEAAHVPVIWATQVLENLAKHGLPSRPEMTDAAMSVRAEAVMLNKGPYMIETVGLLGEILKRMENHQQKKRPRLRALRAW